MDGLSSAATVIQVVDVGVTTLSHLCKYAGAVIKAEKSCADLIKDIKEYRQVLIAIKTQMSVSTSPNASGQTPSRDLSSLWLPKLTQCDNLSAELLAKLESRQLTLRGKFGWPFREKKIMAYIANFQRSKMDMGIILQSLTVDHVRDVRNAVAVSDQRIERVEQLVLTEQKNREDSAEVARQDDTLRWLAYIDSLDKHNFIRKKRHENTCSWIFTDSAYASWRDSNGGVLWLNGKVGAGKTIITSAVIDELLRMDAALAYFYCDFQQARSTNATEIIRSLLAQLLGKSKKKWLSSFPELCKRKAHDLGPPSDNRLLCDWLLSASKLHNRPVIVIDALDECMDQELDDLLDVIPRLNVGHLRVFLSSRPEQIIKDAFVGLPSLSLQERSAFLAKDIRIYITKELQTRRRLRNLPAQLREEIRSVLPPKANGMFRWVQCQLDSLSRCITAAQIRQVLESLPKGLNETYDRILLAIHEKEFHGPFVRRTLTWLVVALEPLHIQQILEAVKIEIGKSIIDDDTGPMNHMMLIDACSSLVNFDEQTQMLSLSHFSVKEYIINEQAVNASLKDYHISIPAAHRRLTLLTFTYILLDDVLERLVSLRFHKRLLGYCTVNGLRHMQHVRHDDDGQLLRLLEMVHLQITERPEKYALIGKELFERQLFSKLLLTPDHVLFLVVCFGSLEFVNRYLDLHPEVINGKGVGNALKYAIDGNRPDVAQELLRRGQDPMWPAAVVGEDGTTRTQDFNAMAFMLSHDWYGPETLESICSSMPSVSRDIIHRLTSQQWYPSLVRCLLERGADATYLDDNADSVLHRFLDSTDGHSDEVYLEITQLLVESDCPIDVPNWIGRTPLHFAAQRGITSVVSFLLERECKIPEDIIHHTRGPACFRLLIQYGANVRAVAKNGDTVLHSLFCRNWPGRANGLEILEALVEGGCDVNAKNEIADPVIFWAVSCDLSAAQYIIDSGAYIPKDILMRTMKYFAIWEDDPRQHGDNLPSYFDMLSFFTRQKLPPDIFAIIGFGRNPLHVLLRGAQPTFYSAKELLELVRSFVEGGCDCLVPDATGETPLYLAVKVRHGELVTYLTSKGAEFSDAKKLHRLPLDWAAQLPWYQSALTAAIALNGGNSCVPDNFYIEGYDRC